MGASVPRPRSPDPNHPPSDGALRCVHRHEGNTVTSILPDDLVSVAWLVGNIGQPTVRVVDIRGTVATQDLGGGRQAAIYAGAPEAYAAAHIPGSVFVDWTKDIVDPDNEVKAQIAPPARFKAAMEAIGVGDDTDVVIVDETGGHLATRLWWALRYYGHERVAILDGGFSAWTAAGQAVTTAVAAVPLATFTPSVHPDLVRDRDQVLAQLSERREQIVDARAEGQYSGAVQRGSRGGHIPGAINMPTSLLADDDGRWKSGEEIAAAARSAGVDLERPIVAYCNGGVTATQLLFGLHRAGAKTYANYDGSWNEWGERPELPVEGNRDLFNDAKGG
ncbi:MAG: sulfurtransferase [Thermomicrobiales bacterium]